MKYVILACRILLGAMFLIFGANNILHFIPMPMPTGQAGLYMGVIGGAGILKLVGVLMVIAGLLLLVGRFVPLALTILGPLIVNILMYHFMIDHGGAAPGLIATILWILLMFAYRANFLPLFQADPKPVTP